MTSNSPARSVIDSSEASGPMWYLADGVCALADSERHLGHAIQEGDSWTAYDAVHPNESHDGLLALGRFKSIGAAVHAIERSVGVFESRLAPVIGQSMAFHM